MNFSDLGLSPETLKAVEEVGYANPTPIQEQAIPHVLMGRDVLGIAQTGTGKTAGFTLPMIDILVQGRAKARMPRSLILAPTRELANQVAENFNLYGKYQKLSMALLIGGESFSEQEKALDRGVDVLIATPGRLLDLFDRGRILMRDVKILVIDEADRMLDMGFIPDVERIVSLLPPLRQTLFFSATMDKSIRKLADAFLSNPKEVRVAPKQQTAATVTQTLVVVDEYDKRQALRSILASEDVHNAFIFCNRKRDVATLYRSLKKHGFDAAQLHGDMSQPERTATLAQFKAGEVKLLVCSDVAARGIDIADVSHVFNFDVPTHSEDYVHRIGRTGRAGREGRAFTIATPEDTKYVVSIEKLIGNPIPRLDLDGIETQDLSEEAAKAARKARRSGGDKKRSERRTPRRSPQQDDVVQTPTQDAASSDQPSTPDSTAMSEDEARTDNRSEGRQDTRSRRDRGGRGRRNHPAWEVEEMDHGDDVLAFGGHTPAFMLVDISGFASTAEALLSDEDADLLEDEIIHVVDEIEEVDTPDEVESPYDDSESKPRARRRRRGRDRDRDSTDADEAEIDNEDSSQVVDADDDETDAATGEPARSPRRRRSARRRKADQVKADQATAQPDAGSETDAPAAEAAPTDAPAEATADNAPVSADATTAKPKRTARRRKAAPAAKAPAESDNATSPVAETAGETDAVVAPTETPAQVEAEADAEAATTKPKRTRKPAAKKAPATKKTTATRAKSTRSKAAKAEAPAEGAVETATPVPEEAAPVASAEAVAADAAVAETDAPVKKRAPRKTAAKKTTTTKRASSKTTSAAATKSTATKTTRSRKKATEETATDTPADAEATASEAKPKRTRAPRRKKAETAETPAPAENSGSPAAEGESA